MVRIDDEVPRALGVADLLVVLRVEHMDLRDDPAQRVRPRAVPPPCGEALGHGGVRAVRKLLRAVDRRHERVVRRALPREELIERGRGGVVQDLIAAGGAMSDERWRLNGERD